MKSELPQALQEFNRIYKEMNELYHEIARNLQLSDSAFDVLYALYVSGDGCLQRDVCAMSATSKQTVHSAVRQLERAGWLRFQTGRGRDRHMFLTEAGRQLAEEKIRPVLAAECAVFAAMEPEQREMLLTLNRAYLTQLRQTAEQAGLSGTPNHSL